MSATSWLSAEISPQPISPSTTQPSCTATSYRSNLTLSSPDAAPRTALFKTARTNSAVLRLPKLFLSVDLIV